MAPEDLDGHRTTLPVADQAGLDREFPPLAVAGVPELGPLAAATLKVNEGPVIKDQGTFLQVAPGPALLDGVVALEQPVQSAVEAVFVEVGEADRGEGIGSGSGLEAAGGGELGAGMSETGDDQSHDEIALGAGRSQTRSKPIWRREPRRAAMWPWGGERTMSKEDWKSGTAGPFLSRMRNPSTSSGDHLERWARGRFLTWPSGR